MTPLVWSSAFGRDVKRRIRRDPQLRVTVEETLRQLTADPYHYSLKTHPLKGELAGTWACSVTYDLRFIFEFRQNPKTNEQEIFLLAFGSHDEVY